jgi:hypothetical protein
VEGVTDFERDAAWKRIKSGWREIQRGNIRRAAWSEGVSLEGTELS